MNLVGPISPVTSAGNRYILTVIDTLTGFTVAVPILDKKQCVEHTGTMFTVHLEEGQEY